MNDNIVNLLLKPSALPYLREVRRQLDVDHEYLSHAPAAVGKKVHQILSQGGVIWDEEIFQREWKGVVKEAVMKLRTVEL